MKNQYIFEKLVSHLNVKSLDQRKIFSLALPHFVLASRKEINEFKDTIPIVRFNENFEDFTDQMIPETSGTKVFQRIEFEQADEVKEIHIVCKESILG